MIIDKQINMFLLCYILYQIKHLIKTFSNGVWQFFKKFSQADTQAQSEEVSGGTSSTGNYYRFLWWKAGTVFGKEHFTV